MTQEKKQDIIILPKRINISFTDKDEDGKDRKWYLREDIFRGPFFFESEPGEENEFLVEEVGENKITLRTKSGAIFSTPGGIISDTLEQVNPGTKQTIFTPIQISENIIALKGNNDLFLSFGDKITEHVTVFNMDIDTGKVLAYSLKAIDRTINSNCKFTIEEPIISKEIVDVEYDLDNKKIKNFAPIVSLIRNISTDPGQASYKSTVEFEYKKSVVGTWNNSAGVEVGVSTTVEAGIPFLAEGKIEVTAKTDYRHEWGGSTGTEETKKFIDEVTVLGGEKTKRYAINSIISQAEIDVPFTYKMRVKYLDGSTEVIDGKKGIYNNIETYHIEAQVKDVTNIVDATPEYKALFEVPSNK